MCSLRLFVRTHAHTPRAITLFAPRPMAVTNAVAPSVVRAGAQAIAAGGDHSILLKGDGTVWATGKNFHGQLGDGTWFKKDEFEEVFKGQ